jgi:hypothetical protein
MFTAFPVLRETKVKIRPDTKDETSWVSTGKVEVIVRPYVPIHPETGLTVEVEYARVQNPSRVLSVKIIGSVENLTIKDAQNLAMGINMAIGAAAARQLELFNCIYWAGA